MVQSKKKSIWEKCSSVHAWWIAGNEGGGDPNDGSDSGSMDIIFNLGTVPPCVDQGVDHQYEGDDVGNNQGHQSDVDKIIIIPWSTQVWSLTQLSPGHFYAYDDGLPLQTVIMDNGKWSTIHGSKNYT